MKMNTFNLEPAKEEDKEKEEMDSPSIGETSFDASYSDEPEAKNKKGFKVNKKLIMIAGGLVVFLLVLMLVFVFLNKAKKELTPKLQLSAQELVVGKTVHLKSDLDIEQYNKLIWSSNDETIATVNAGVVTGVSEGVAYIKATYPGAKSQTVELTVISDKEKFEISGGNIDLKPAETKELKVNSAESSEIKWSSSAPLVASISKGVVTAHNSGTATIIATNADGETSKILVTVTGEKPAPTSISIAPVKNFYLENTYQLEVNILPVDAIRNYSFTSSDPSIITVDKNGVLRGLRAGTVTIELKSYNGEVAVVEAEVS